MYPRRDIFCRIYIVSSGDYRAATRSSDKVVDDATDRRQPLPSCTLTHGGHTNRHRNPPSRGPRLLQHICAWSTPRTEAARNVTRHQSTTTRRRGAHPAPANVDDDDDDDDNDDNDDDDDDNDDAAIIEASRALDQECPNGSYGWIIVLCGAMLHGSGRASWLASRRPKQQEEAAA
ncbi:hypothetical protein ARSEF4850_009421 [Beauveria asiatica]